jgi:uncharacterized protein (DUF1810 family)
MSMRVPSDIQRFVEAQQAVYGRAFAELRQGRKTTHWMWFVFPQLRGLGHSAMSAAYGLESGAEALAYWQDETLGQRLRDCTEQLLRLENKSAHEVFGSPDDLKLRSCMTLFEQVSGDSRFAAVLARFYAGERDRRTLELLPLGRS